MKIGRLLLPIIFLTFIGNLYAQESASYANISCVVLDAGHGGKDPGALGALYREKDIVLDVVLRLGKKIQTQYPDIKVIYTRSKDEFIDLAKRGDIANKAHANLFISIHTNSANTKTTKKPHVKGAETFVMGTGKLEENMEVAKLENAVILLEDDYTQRYAGFNPESSESYILFALTQNAYINQSLEIAGDVQSTLKDKGRINRGVKRANLVVLWKTTMPSILIELGFISNPEEEKYMGSNAGKEELAQSIFSAFSKYKDRIEGRSHFDLERTKPDSITPSPATDIQYAIQIAGSAKKLDTAPKNFKKLQNVERIQATEKFYKYITSRTQSETELNKNLTAVRKLYPDAFPIGIDKDNKIIPFAEAKKRLNGK